MMNDLPAEGKEMIPASRFRSSPVRTAAARGE